MRSFAGLVLLTLTLLASPARAQRDLARSQSDAWYATHGALLGGATIANVAALSYWHPTEPRLDATFRWERGTEKNLAPTTAHVSDGTLLASMALPVGSLATRTPTAWGNALLVYGEALEGSLLMNTLTKKTVARARPYTHHPAAGGFSRARGSDAYYSFYSGHSALSFSGATAGSWLFAALHDDIGIRTAHWAGALSLAGFTAHARVRAGQHYPTDVIVGSVLGTAWGVGVPLLHGIRPELEPAEVAGAAGGFAGGVLLAGLLPRRSREESSTIEPLLLPRPGGALVSVSIVLP